MSDYAPPDFEGHADRECGEHRTTGGRAWCFSCSEWCYENIPCKGCEIPMLRAVIAKGVEAFRLTREYVGEDVLPAIEGWSWFDWTTLAQQVIAADYFGSTPPP